MTTLAKCAETRAYTPPDEPTTGAVMSVTDTARDPAVMTVGHVSGEYTNKDVVVSFT